MPIDRYSYEAIELLKDLIAHWQTLRSLKAASAFANGGNLAPSRATDVPDIELYAIDVSFEANPDPAEREYLNSMPTSFALIDEQVDWLRAAAAVAMRASSEYERLLRDLAKPSPTATMAPVQTTVIYRE